jgi:hypothetical protein
MGISLGNKEMDTFFFFFSFYLVADVLLRSPGVAVAQLTLGKPPIAGNAQAASSSDDVFLAPGKEKEEETISLLCNMQLTSNNAMLVENILRYCLHMHER